MMVMQWYYFKIKMIGSSKYSLLNVDGIRNEGYEYSKA